MNNLKANVQRLSHQQRQLFGKHWFEESQARTKSVDRREINDCCSNVERY